MPNFRYRFTSVYIVGGKKGAYIYFINVFKLRSPHITRWCVSRRQMNCFNHFVLINQSINQSINQLSKCLISVSTDSKAHHPIREA